MTRTFDNFGAIEAASFSNFDTDFQYAEGPAVSPETTQQLAQLGTQLVGRAAQNKAAKNALLPEFEVGLESQCGKKPANFRKKKGEEYEKCKTTYKSDYDKRIADTRATAEATALAATSAGGGATGTTGGMSSNMKIGIGVGALVVLVGIIYAVTK
jgi:hypothetical protein